MRVIRHAWRGLLLVLLLVSPAAAAQPKPIGTVTFDGVTGLTAVPIVGFSWTAKSELVASGGGGAVTRKAVFEPFVVVKPIDVATPLLLDLTVRGEQIGEVRIDVTPRRGVKATYVLSTVAVTGNERFLAEGGGAALQRVALTAVRVRETVTTAGGSVTTCYDVGVAASCD